MNFPMWIIWVVIGLIAFEGLCRIYNYFENKKLSKEKKGNG